MKKQILLIISVAISALTIAQVNPSFGVRAGVSSASVRGDAINNLDNLLDFTNGIITTGSHTGFFAGSYATISFSDLIAIEPALYYSQKGFELRGALNIKGAEFLGANAKAKLNMQYVDLPVLVKANFKGLQLFAGPQVSYLAQADLNTTAGVFGFNLLNNKMNVSDQFNKWDVALTGGVGYRFVNGLNITAAYDHGLSKIDANRNLKSYNRSIKVGVGFGF